MTQIQHLMKYFESTRGNVATPKKEEVEEIYLGPKLTEYAKELIRKVENRKKGNKT